VTRIANKANEICTSEKKKTISLDHLYKSIEFFHLNDQMDSLKKVEQEVKNDVMVQLVCYSGQTRDEAADST
jgi:hypothetical protein